MPEAWGKGQFKVKYKAKWPKFNVIEKRTIVIDKLRKTVLHRPVSRG
jgi:hypothetical protein